MILVEEEEEEADVMERGRLGPGEMIGVNLLQQTLYHDYELKDHLAAEKAQKQVLHQIPRFMLVTSPLTSMVHQTDLMTVIQTITCTVNLVSYQHGISDADFHKVQLAVCVAFGFKVGSQLRGGS